MRIKDAQTSQEMLALQLHKAVKFTHRLRHVEKDEGKTKKTKGISPYHGQGRLLNLLKDGESFSIAELVEQLDIRPSSASELISKLEQNGLVSRSACDEDKRVTLIKITEKGKALLSDNSENKAAYFTDMFSGLTPEEQEQLSELLTKLVSSLKEKGEARGIEMKGPGRHHKMHHRHRGY